jgi:hypothetical protein
MKLHFKNICLYTLKSPDKALPIFLIFKRGFEALMMDEDANSGFVCFLQAHDLVDSMLNTSYIERP